MTPKFSDADNVSTLAWQSLFLRFFHLPQPCALHDIDVMNDVCRGRWRSQGQRHPASAIRYLNCVTCQFTHRLLCWIVFFCSTSNQIISTTDVMLSAACLIVPIVFQFSVLNSCQSLKKQPNYHEDHSLWLIAHVFFFVSAPIIYCLCCNKCYHLSGIYW